MGQAQPRSSEADVPHFERVLVVEDEPRIRKRLVQLFRMRGARVREAATVAAAVPKLDPSPDLVVVDVRLPDGSGRAIVEACGLLEPVPAMLAISGMASAREAFELAQLGVDAFVPKPFSWRVFEAQLSSMTAPRAAPRSDRARLSPQTTALLSERLKAFASARGLSGPEQDIVRLALSGLPRRHFAEVLGVSENTCKTRIRRLLRKCDASSLADVPRLLLLRVR